jgi:hypothetical protein
MIGIDGSTHNAALNSAIQEKVTTPSSKAVSTTSIPNVTKQQPARRPQEDQVVLSEQSKELSKIMQNKRTVEQPDLKVEAKAPEKAPEMKSPSVIEVVKYFPPYLNSVRRQEMMQDYPLLRKQIDQMTIPPPPGLFQDAQNQSSPSLQEITVAAESQK